MVSRVLAAGLRPAGASAPQSRLLRNIAVLAGGQLVTWALSLGWTLVVPRMIGPKGTGQLMAADSAANATFSEFPGSRAIARWKEASARAQSKSTTSSIRPIWAWADAKFGFSAKARSTASRASR